MQALELFEQYLKSHGQSITTPRRFIFTLFLNSPHLSVEQVLELTRGSINRASVYRIIARFEEMGLLDRIYLSRNEYRLELAEQFSSHHHNFICERCGSVISFAEPALMPDMLRRLSERHGLDISHHTFSLRGCCKACRTSLTTKT